MRIGIVGTGWGSRVQVPAFRGTGHQVVAIAGHDAEKTRRIAADLGVVAFASAAELVERAEIDLVSIASPPATHLPLSRLALERGLHVLCEKPTALDAAEATEMLELARRHPSRRAMIDHELRFLPSWLEAKRRVGTIGPIRTIEVRYSSPSRRSPDRAWTWWSDRSQHGGIWGAVGSHFVDAVRYLAGEIDAVQGVLATFVPSRPFGSERRPVTSDDFAAAHLRLKSGALAVMSFSVVAAVDEETTLTLTGEQGALRLAGTSLLEARDGRWTTAVEPDGADVPGNSPGGPFGSGTIALGHALRRAFDEGNDRALDPAATFEDGLRQQQALDALRRSHADRGGRVTLPR